MQTRRLKIIFDAESLVRGNLTGVGRSTEGLIAALARNYPHDVELVGHYFNFLNRLNPSSTLPTGPNIRYRRTVTLPRQVFTMLRRLGLRIPFELLAKERGDFHLFPAFIGWSSLFKTPSAPFIHDVTYLLHPQYVNDIARYDLIKLVPQTIQRASFVITNSQSSKEGLQSAYKLQIPVLVEHIPPVGALDIKDKQAGLLLQKLGIHTPFILFFGTIEPRKNLTNLLQAYTQLSPDIQRTHALVIAGGKGWHDTAIIDQISQLQASGVNIKQLGYVSDQERAALFKKTAVYVMPSYYEGFGMQLLEGMTYRTPMIASDIPVLREVAQDAALYCNTDADSITKAITVVISDELVRQKLIKAGVARLTNFSWDTVSHQIFRAIKEAVK